MTKNQTKFHPYFIACLLTFCAGFIDAYTFIERGGTLVAGQTGNVVLLSVSMVHDQFEDVEVKFVTLLAFITGIFLWTVLKHHLSTYKRRLAALLPLVLASVWAGWLPVNTWNMLIVPPLGFCMGLVTTAFTEVDGRFYNNAFMTGNLKRMMMAWGDYFRTQDKTFLTDALFLLRLVVSFILGALVSAFLTRVLGLQTIWFVALLLLGMYAFELALKSEKFL